MDWELNLMKSIPQIRLNNGNEIPVLGLGTFKIQECARPMEAIFEDAFSVGIRLIDTAQGYHNEKIIGDTLCNLGVARSSYQLMTKLDDDVHFRKGAIEAIERSLEDLRTDYIDFFLIHSPNSEVIQNCGEKLDMSVDDSWQKLNAEAWEVFEEYHEKGFIKNIGVSNFYPHHLEQLLQTANILPVVNQIKTTVGSILAEKKVVNYCRNKSIHVCGYSPLGKGNLINNSELYELAQKYDRSVAQVLLRFLFESGFTSIVKSTSKQHLEEIASIFDFSIQVDDKSFLEKYMIEENWAKVRNPDTGEKYNH